VNQFLPFIVVGLATGAVYGLAGIGLVLTYKTSGIFNFGYGAVAALVSFCFYLLNSHGVPWGAAAAISLLVFAPACGLLLELMARTLSGASETIKVVATVGLILIVESIATIWYPTNPPNFPDFLPQSTVRMVGVNVTWAQIILFVFSAVAAAGLYWFFKSVRSGVVMRAVVDNADLVSMSGDDPVLVRRRAWIIGSVFAGAAGLFLAPELPIDGITLTTAVFAAFGAAAIGYFTNLPLTFVGGLLVGVAGALVDKYSATISWVGGLAPALPFIILFVVLIVLPKRLLVQRQLPVTMPARDTYVAPPRIRLGAGGIAVLLFVLVPVIASGYVSVWSAALINIILFLSLGLLVRRSGQISLCHLAFAAVGAAAFGHFAGNDHIPWLISLVLATLVAIPVGAIVAIPAVRVSKVFLALATLGFGILMEQALYTRDFMFGQSTLGLSAPRPDVSIGPWNLSSDTGFYYVLLIITVLTVIVLAVINRGRLGRLLEAMSDSTLALETHGATSSVLKVIVFCIAAALASMAGALEVMLFNVSIGTYFPSFNSLILVVLVVIVTAGDPWYAVIAAVGYSVLPAYITGSDTQSVLNLIFGLSAAAVALTIRQGTTPEPVRRFLDRLGGREPAASRASVVTEAAVPQHAAAEAAVSPDAAGQPPRAAVRQGLTVRDLSVRFGGVHAVVAVSIDAPGGKITGLIGPNGAGKTTTFNACSGLVRPSSGRVMLHDLDVTRKAAPRRARQGLGRTFQRTELFSSLTVRQNIAMGREASMAGANPLAQVIGSRHSHRIIAEAVDEALELTGTTRIADAQAGLLPIGQRRLVELARALAGPFDMFLLDEPSSGLDGHETEKFGQVLRTVVRERGCGILLVEHDMSLVREICDYVYVLDFGQLIFEGTTEEMQHSAQVRVAYLGGSEEPIVTRE
jgi:ABC-type branched-subunit amino acid transport system ATPase component/branched-subunit amino acid ABC-type transport system permease component